MKTPFFLLTIALNGIGFAEETPPASMPPKDPPPALPAKQESKPVPPKIRFKGKTGAPTNCTVTATRNGAQPNIRLVALAPGNEGVTRKARPRLWWYQSEPTKAGDLEIALSRMDGPSPKVLLQGPMRAMQRGFNFVDFGQKEFDTKDISLESGGIYQWTIRLISEKTAPQVFCRMKVSLTESPDAVPDLQKLAESGNWYELFDAVSTGAQKPSPESENLVNLRRRLLQDIGLLAAVE